MKEEKNGLYNEKIECKIKYDNADSCLFKYNTLKESLKNQKMKSIPYRISILKKLLEIWDKYESLINKSNFIDLGQSEIISSMYSFALIRKEITFAIDNLKNWVKPIKCDTPLFIGYADSYVIPEPFGLTLIFSAWNCNFLTLIVPLVQAIAAGNLCLCKPASMSPETCKVCMMILNELPNDVIQCCAGKSEVYTQLLKLRYDLIIFTGSAAKGKLIAQAAAPFLTPTILELGGQNPVIVDKTANIELTAKNILFGRHVFDGQACIAPEYIMCDRVIYSKLVAEIQKRVVEFYGEKPLNSPFLGRIINEMHYDRIYKLIADPGDGAKILYGDIKQCDKGTKFIPPMFFGFESLEIMGKSELAKDEIFGPVLYIAPYDKIENAVQYINEREKPLSAYLFTNDSSIKQYVRDNTSSGCLDINDTVYHFSSYYLPFGGVGNSGMGAYHGKWGFQHMSHWKPILDQSQLIMNIKYPPYDGFKSKFLKKILIKFNYGRNQLINWFIYFIISIILIVYGIKMKNKYN